jgi:hypothetical protein
MMKSEQIKKNEGTGQERESGQKRWCKEEKE